MMLPKDPVILLSVINTKLRDYYKSLDDLCDDMNISREDLIKSIAATGYAYSEERNQFI